MANVKGSYGRFSCISNEEGKLLLVQRGWYVDSKTNERKWDGRWNYPGGGVDEKDAEVSATPEKIMYREVVEETGLEVMIADYRPVGEYPTVKHTDIAITYLCKVVGGHLVATAEGTDFCYVSPSKAMEIGRRGDVPYGLVGGLQTSTGGVPRHIQMVLHYFTRVCDNSQYRKEAEEYCDTLGIPV